MASQIYSNFQMRNANFYKFNSTKMHLAALDGGGKALSRLPTRYKGGWVEGKEGNEWNMGKIVAYLRGSTGQWPI